MGPRRRAAGRGRRTSSKNDQTDVETQTKHNTKNLVYKFIIFPYLFLCIIECNYYLCGFTKYLFPVACLAYDFIFSGCSISSKDISFT